MVKREDAEPRTGSILGLGKCFSNNRKSQIVRQIMNYKMQENEEFSKSYSYESSEQRYSRPKKQQNYRPGQKNGRWNEVQSAKYIAYLQFYKDKFRSKQKRRAHKFYKQMSLFIETRNPLQCRSHHQKLEDKYRYSNRIISNYKQTTDLTLYHEFKLNLQSTCELISLKQLKIVKPLQSTNEISIQTELEGVSIRFITWQEYESERMNRPLSWSNPHSNTVSQQLEGRSCKMQDNLNMLYYSFDHQAKRE